MSTADKLNYLNETKQAIKTALVEKGVSVSNTDTFRSYADKIVNMEVGGGGDVVYAINNTSSTITKGQKVWLNKHNLDNLVSNQEFHYGINYNLMNYIFDGSNNAIGYFQEGSNAYKFTYDTSSKTWSYARLAYSFESSALKFVRNFENLDVFYKSTPLNSVSGNFSYIVSELNYFPFQGWYLGDNLLMTYNSTNKFDIKRVNTTNGTVGDTLITVTQPNSNDFRSAFLDGNILFVSSYSGGHYYFYDISKIEHSTPSVETLGLGTKASLDNDYPMMYATGTSIGSYFIFNTGYQQNNSSATFLNILMVGEDYQLVEPTGLPADLMALINQKCFVHYNNYTKILTVGTYDNVYAFIFENGTFVNINLTIQLPSFKPYSTEYTYRLYLTDDLTTAVISACVNSYAGEDTALYKLKTLSNEWYADGYGMINSNTLTGVATGNVNSGGFVEVKTFLGVS